MSFIIYILCGAAAGWLAGQIMRGQGFGFLKNVLIGIVGGVVGGWVFSLIGFEGNGIVAGIITATAGALILLYVAGKLRGDQPEDA